MDLKLLNFNCTVGRGAEDILANTMGLPLQPVRTFGKNGVTHQNMLIFGDNLQAMKTLVRMKEEGQLVNADGTPGARLIYIDPPFVSAEIKHPQYCRFPRSGGGGNLGGDAVGTL